MSGGYWAQDAGRAAAEQARIRAKADCGCNYFKAKVAELEARVETLAELHDIDRKAVAAAHRELIKAEQRDAELEAENVTLLRMLSAKPETANSTGAAQAMMEHQISLHDRRAEDFKQRAEAAESRLAEKQSNRDSAASEGSVYTPAYHEGMTYRKWLIGQALKGLLSRPPICGTPNNYAAWAIEYADAVLRADK